MLKPTSGNIIIKPIEPEQKTSTGILIPDSTQEKPQVGEIIASSVKELMVGLKVYYKKWGGDQIKHEGQEYIVVDKKDVIAIL